MHKGQNIHLTYSHSDVKFQLVKGSRTEVDLIIMIMIIMIIMMTIIMTMIMIVIMVIIIIKSGLTEVGDDDDDLKWTWMNCM